MADLSIQDASETGLNISFAAAAVGGDKIANGDGRVILLVKNDDTVSHTATAAVEVTSDDDPKFGEMTKANQDVVVPAGDIGELGPFPPMAYNDTNGDVNITYDAITSVTVAAIRVI